MPKMQRKVRASSHAEAPISSYVDASGMRVDVYAPGPTPDHRMTAIPRGVSYAAPVTANKDMQMHAHTGLWTPRYVTGE